MKDTTTGSKEPTYSYVLYVPSCVNCDNGFTDYTKKFVFKEKIKEPVVETEYKYNETDIKICRECSIVIKERDDKYLTGVTHENYKLVRRCKTTD